MSLERKTLDGCLFVLFLLYVFLLVHTIVTPQEEEECPSDIRVMFLYPTDIKYPSI